MLQVNQLVGFGGGVSGAGVVPVTKTYDEQTHASAPGAVTYTFEDQDLGVDATTRKIVVLAQIQTGGGSQYMKNVQIDDGSGFVDLMEVSYATSTSWSYSTSIWQIDSITAGTGDIKYIMSADHEIDVWVYTMSGATRAAYDIGIDEGQTSGGLLTTTLDIPANGCAIALAVHAGNPLTGSSHSVWTGLTEDSDVTVNENGGKYLTASSASALFEAAQSGLTISSDHTSTNINTGGASLATASFGPLVGGPACAGHIASYETGTNATTYTLAASDFGSPTLDAGKLVFIIAGRNDTGSGTWANVSTVTESGNSASTVLTQDGTANGVEMFQLNGREAGALGEIVIVFNAGQTALSVGLFIITGDVSDSPTDTGVSTAAPLSSAITIPALGCAIGGAESASDSSATWVNLHDKRSHSSIVELNSFGYEATNASVAGSGACKNSIGGSTATVTCTWGSSSNPAMVLAAWGPA